jgi:AcrR family transcriptional regulator
VLPSPCPMARSSRANADGSRYPSRSERRPSVGVFFACEWHLSKAARRHRSSGPFIFDVSFISALMDDLCLGALVATTLWVALFGHQMRGGGICNTPGWQAVERHLLVNESRNLTHDLDGNAAKLDFDRMQISKRPPPKRASASGFAPKVDGRRLRSERTRQLIIEACLSLLRDTSQMPTAVQIAELAGYSVRSIFERFPDLNALRLAVTDYQLAQALALAPQRGADGNRETRLRSQVNTRAHTCERGVAVWRVLLQFADQDATGQLKQRIARARETTIGRIELMYRAELSSVPEDEGRQLLIALEALTDMESWALMREQHGLSFEEACDVWVGAIDRLLPPTPDASHRPTP